MKKKGFTLVEVLVASSIMGVVLIASISVMSFATHMLYSGQIESQNRISLSDNIYYLTREIQSAEGIKISADCKTLKIKQLGHSVYNMEYALADGTPTGALLFKDKKMLDISFSQSSFKVIDSKVKIILAIYKNNLDFRQVAQKIDLEVKPRSKEVVIEIEN